MSDWDDDHRNYTYISGVQNLHTDLGEWMVYLFCDDAAFNQPYRGTFYYTYQKHRIAEFYIQGKKKPLSMQAAFTHKLAVLYNACLQEIGALQRKKSEMVEYLQSTFGEEGIANKVEFASFLKKSSELVEADHSTVVE